MCSIRYYIIIPFKYVIDPTICPTLSKNATGLYICTNFCLSLNSVKHNDFVKLYMKQVVCDQFESTPAQVDTSCMYIFGFVCLFQFNVLTVVFWPSRCHTGMSCRIRGHDTTPHYIT